MRRGFVLLLAGLLVSCNPGGALKITRLPNGVIRAELNGDGNCIEWLRIAHVDSYDEAGVVWEISRRNGNQTCLKSIDYPVVPPEFDVQTAVKPLTPGRYWVTGKAEQFYLSGNLEATGP